MEAVRLNKSVTVVFSRDGYDYMAFVDEDDSCEYDEGDGEIVCREELSHSRFDCTEAAGKVDPLVKTIFH